jgi:hypothetical protein
MGGMLVSVGWMYDRLKRRGIETSFRNAPVAMNELLLQIYAQIHTGRVAVHSSQTAFFLIR